MQRWREVDDHGLWHPDHAPEVPGAHLGAHAEHHQLDRQEDESAVSQIQAPESTRQAL